MTTKQKKTTARRTSSLYRYKAVNKKGRIINGSLSAYDDVHLYQQLEAVGLSLIKSNQIARSQKSFLGGFGQEKITLRDKVQFYFQLNQLQKAEIPLTKALDYASSAINNQRMQDVVNDLKRMVSEGLSMSESMAKFPEVFPRLEVAIIKVSEHTGDTLAAYQYLISYTQDAEKMQQQLKKATRYPIILVTVILLAVGILMGYVVPQITSFLKVANGAELPIYTIALMAVSDFFQSYGHYVAGLILLTIIAIKTLRKKSNAFRYKTDQIALSMPVAGPLIRKLEVARFFHVLSTLYMAGIPIINSLKEARKVINNEILKAASLELIEDVNSGKTIAASMLNTGEFEALSVQLIDVAEKSSGMEKAFIQVSDIYKNDVDEAIDAMVSYIEPALTMVMGIMIFWIIISVFGPIYSTFEDIGI